MDGNMLAVAYSAYTLKATFHVATHDLSTTRTHFYPIPEGRVIPPIWTHGEFLRFATAKPESITVWQVEFTMTHPPEAVESFPAPDGIAITVKGGYPSLLFLPSPSRLEIALKDSHSVWDVRDSKLLLKTDFTSYSSSFSSDGRFFAYTSIYNEVYLWKESPAGYVLHQKFSTFRQQPKPRLSPNGEYILVSLRSKIHLRHTKYPILPDHPLQHVSSYGFDLVFSPDDLSATFASLWGKTVTVLDLRSGDPQLVIDTDMEVTSLGVTGSAIVVVGQDEVGSWSLTAGEAGVKFISDIVHKKTLDFSQSQSGHNSTLCSVSPDLSRIVISGFNDRFSSAGLDIYDTSTGSHHAGVEAGVLKISSLPMLSTLLI